MSGIITGYITALGMPDVPQQISVGGSADNVMMIGGTLGIPGQPYALTPQAFPCPAAFNVFQGNNASGNINIAALPWVFSNSFVSSVSNVSDSTILAANVCFFPFYIGQGEILPLNYYTYVNAALAASSINLGIYGSNGTNQPNGSPIIQLNIPTTSTGIQSASVSTALSYNTLYFLGIQISSGTVLSITAAPLNVSNFGTGIILASSYSAQIWTQSNSFVAGVLPSITVINASSFVNFPVIGFTN